MKDEEFWNIIKNIKEDHKVTFLSKKEILEFDKKLKVKLIELYKFSLMEISFVVLSYISDETFREFRSWLILQGKEKFYTTLKEPETITNWLNKKEIGSINDLGENLLAFTRELYIKHGGTEEEFDSKEFVEIEPEIEMEWAETKEDYRKKYPQVVDNFWNQQLIDELH